MSELAIQIGIKIKLMRKMKAISQEHLALLCSIDRSYMGRIERGEVNMTVKMLYEIASALEVDMKDLLP